MVLLVSIQIQRIDLQHRLHPFEACEVMRGVDLLDCRQINAKAIDPEHTFTIKA